MASTQKVRLLVKDDDDVVVVDDEIDGSVTGEQLFREMNSRCAFALWERADAMGPAVMCPVMNSLFARQDQAFAKQSLKLIIDSLCREGVPCEFTFQVRKRTTEYETNSDAPGGPVAPKNAGLRPRQGPDYGGFETPAGPGVTLARMRGMLSRL